VLEPGRHGLVIAYRERRATFLPQVWSSLPAASDFVGELKAKAGLPRDFWSPAMEAWRYTTDTFREADWSRPREATGPAGVPGARPESRR
jgi:AMMECR1 domain-containing protein